MELNNIKCKNYTAGDKFRAVLIETTEEDIKSITPENLKVTIENNELVESFTSYGRLFSIKHNFIDETYEVEFEKISPFEKVAKESMKLCESLQEKIDELELKNKSILEEVEKLTTENKTIVEKLASIKDTNISSLFIKEE